MDYQNHPPRSKDIIAGLARHKVASNLRLEYQKTRPVYDMWEGLDRFMKTVEINGLFVTDFKEFQHATMERNDRLDDLMSNRMTKAEFKAKITKTKEKLN